MSSLANALAPRYMEALQKESLTKRPTGKEQATARFQTVIISARQGSMRLYQTVVFQGRRPL